ncbi:MMPL family transporter [Aldersonia kunmingensis]|uniref:MMPL family transporter n=1 Tax=Aldersonia kunmingensis TaxID=408066 RepID=UPI000836D8D9|nr:MMPL family transporter [Aldersonia kunmingensis]
MFDSWGNIVYRFRFGVIGLMVAGLLALGAYGLGLEKHLSQSGWDDPGSESAQAARLADETYGRDHGSDVVVLYTAPPGKTVDDPQFSAAIVNNLNSLPREHPDQIIGVNVSYWKTETGQQAPLADKTKQHAFATVGIKGDNDTEQTENFREVRDAFYIDGIDVQLAGLQPVAGTLNDTMAQDVRRMELLAIPAVAVLLFFIFGGLVAAALPLIVGGLTVVGAWGIVRFITEFTEVNAFVSPVVSLIGLGLAIDYGLFIVSRFREEIAEGHTTGDAVRRSVMTAGRTVVFSATMIVASLGGLLIFPQGFLKSVAYGAIATVSLAALTAVTVLPAILGILGPRIDMLGFKWLRKTKTAEEVESGFWGRITRQVMKHPLRYAIPIVVGLLLLIIPVKNITFGGINERYLPPDNSTRLAQEEFDQLFPLRPTEPIKLVVTTENSRSVGQIRQQANQAPGLASDFVLPTSQTKDNVWILSGTLEERNNAQPTIDYLRSMAVPADATMLVGGTPAIERDSIDALLDKMPWMVLLVLLVTTLLMFLTFGSLVLPIKAALMSALGLGATLGILTWIFVDGHGAGILNFTPEPIMAPVLVLIIAIIYGLSTDYEVFLLSRMVEARTMGASTTEAIRIGTAHTGRIISAAAVILIVVTGAFGFSELVMMQYIAYGMIAALIIDATLIRMFLVPSVMKLLGDDCWWAPAWMKRIQARIGLAEPVLVTGYLPDDVVDLTRTAVAAKPKPPPRRRRRNEPEIPADDTSTVAFAAVATLTEERPAAEQPPAEQQSDNADDAPTEKHARIEPEPTVEPESPAPKRFSLFEKPQGPAQPQQRHRAAENIPTPQTPGAEPTPSAEQRPSAEETPDVDPQPPVQQQQQPAKRQQSLFEKPEPLTRPHQPAMDDTPTVQAPRVEPEPPADQAPQAEQSRAEQPRSEQKPLTQAPATEQRVYAFRGIKPADEDVENWIAAPAPEEKRNGDSDDEPHGRHQRTDKSLSVSDLMRRKGR